MKEIRPLRADEIEVRVGAVGAKGATMLLYKNARVDMAILDETFGAENWQRDHKEVKGNLYCGIGIWDDKKACWVWKWDCGTESNTEKEKGEASDSFKRAGTNWGIGRELYTSPFIFLPVATVEYKQGNYTKYKLYNPKELYGIKVKELKIEKKDSVNTITHLVLAQDDKEIWRAK